mmetsp:Transcript_78682/g.136474  ORF Transcript_78682/g.136474 Transcript_78682/m.136474 type:complete len:218 (+) Transcript_78682:2021-2674(+)
MSGTLFWISLRQMQVVRPKFSRLMNSITACALSVVSTTMASNIVHAVETATSYFLSIVPKSPRRPWTPWSLPALACALTPRMRWPRSRASEKDDLASSAFTRAACTSRAMFSCCCTKPFIRTFACPRSADCSFSFFIDSLKFSSRVCNCGPHSDRDLLISSSCSTALEVFSCSRRTSVSVISILFRASVRQLCSGTNSASLASNAGRNFSAFPLRLS